MHPRTVLCKSVCRETLSKRSFFTPERLLVPHAKILLYLLFREGSKEAELHVKNSSTKEIEALGRPLSLLLWKILNQAMFAFM